MGFVEYQLIDFVRYSYEDTYGNTRFTKKFINVEAENAERERGYRCYKHEKNQKFSFDLIKKKNGKLILKYKIKTSIRKNG